MYYIYFPCFADTPDARRSLRQNLEMQTVDNAKKFLQEMDAIRSNIDSVESLSNQLQVSCIKLASKVEDADRNMKDFIERASFLETKKSQLLTQSANVNEFLIKYHMKQEEIQLLQSANLSIPNQARAFFATLHRLKEAYADCQSMTEKHFHGTIGFELLEILGQHQDTAYYHLFEWIKQKCESVGNNHNLSTVEAQLLMNDDNSNETNMILQLSIRQLQDMPVYFTQCQELLVVARRNQLIQRFVLILTQGDPASMKSALDLQSYDAVGYIGAMLAWIHQAIAMEQEFLYAILQHEHHHHTGNSNNTSNKKTPATSSSYLTTLSRSTSTGTTAELTDQQLPSPVTRSSRKDNNSSSTSSSSSLSSNQSIVEELLIKIIQGLGRPLKMRLSQTLENNTTLETLYAITDLLTFYQTMFHKMIPNLENILYQTVTLCLQDSRSLFINLLAKQADSLQKATNISCQDLKVSMVTRECARQVVGILIAHDHTLSIMSTNPENDPTMSIDVILGDIIQPLLQACRIAGLQSLSNVEMAVYMLNNVMFLQQEIAKARNVPSKSFSSYSSSSSASSSSLSYSKKSNWLQLLESEANTWNDVLVQEEVQAILKRCELDSMIELLEVLPRDLKASEQIGLQKERMEMIMRNFYNSLFITVSSQFEKLQDPAIREIIRSKIAQRVSDAHALVSELLLFLCIDICFDVVGFIS